MDNSTKNISSPQQEIQLFYDWMEKEYAGKPAVDNYLGRLKAAIRDKNNAFREEEKFGKYRNEFNRFVRRNKDKLTVLRMDYDGLKGMYEDFKKKVLEEGSGEKTIDNKWIEYIDGVEFTLIDDAKEITIARIYIDPKERGKSKTINAYKKLIKKLEVYGKNLYTTIFPDEQTDEQYSKLRYIAKQVGFVPDEEYRNDLTYTYPKNDKPITNNHRQKIIQRLHQEFSDGWVKVLKGASKGHLTKSKLLEIGNEIMGSDFDEYFFWEVTELAWVEFYRMNIEANNRQPMHLLFKMVVDFYENVQPSYDFSSTNKRLFQQYSTSAPVSLMAGWYCGLYNNKQAQVFEPSAGNGLLVILADRGNTYVNELDALRLENLQSQPYKVITNRDASKPFTDYAKSFDAVLSNPPFGKLPSVNRDFGHYRIRKLDHLMVVYALETMKDDGRAALIIGDWTDFNQDGKIKDHRTFFNYLYHYYWVDDIINIDSRKLYNKQGTAFPLRMILIGGRKSFPFGASPTQKEQPKLYSIARNWDELYDRTRMAIEQSNAKRVGIIELAEIEIEKLKIEIR
jgi:hypothetical protein